LIEDCFPLPTLIDQRILIPAPPSLVWSLLADQSLLPRWRVDCQAVQILTTRQFGVGMRRRCTAIQGKRGKDKIEEVTVWYEGLGYEYTLVESRTYKNWVGRLRLQAVPDGTIVQWTITYQTRGILNRMLNALGGRAQIEEDLGNSLRQFRRLVESKGQVGTEVRKRQTLQPVQSIVRSSTQPVRVPREESAADTKPRRPEGLDEAIAAQTVISTPPDATAPALAQTTMPATPPPVPTVVSDTTPTPPKPIEPVRAEDLPPGMPESLKVTPPRGTPKVDISRLRYADEVADNPAIEAPVPREDTQRTQIIRPGLPPPTDPGDTGQISIWEAFGIKPPSQADAEALEEIVKRETGDHQAVTIETPLREGDTFTFSPLYHTMVLRVRRRAVRKGLRIKQARARVKIRR
jgi:uncharacterized membrane protein